MPAVLDTTGDVIPIGTPEAVAPSSSEISVLSSYAQLQWSSNGVSYGKAFALVCLLRSPTNGSESCLAFMDDIKHSSASSLVDMFFGVPGQSGRVDSSGNMADESRLTAESGDSLRAQTASTSSSTKVFGFLKAVAKSALSTANQVVDSFVKESDGPANIRGVVPICSQIVFVRESESVLSLYIPKRSDKEKPAHLILSNLSNDACSVVAEHFRLAYLSGVPFVRNSGTGFAWLWKYRILSDVLSMPNDALAIPHDASASMAAIPPITSADSNSTVRCGFLTWNCGGVLPVVAADPSQASSANTSLTAGQSIEIDQPLAQGRQGPGVTFDPVLLGKVSGSLKAKTVDSCDMFVVFLQEACELSLQNVLLVGNTLVGAWADLFLTALTRNQSSEKRESGEVGLAPAIPNLSSSTRTAGESSVTWQLARVEEQIGLLLAIYVRADRGFFLHDTHACRIKTGTMGLTGNKGAVALRCVLKRGADAARAMYLRTKPERIVRSSSYRPTIKKELMGSGDLVGCNPQKPDHLDLANESARASWGEAPMILGQAPMIVGQGLMAGGQSVVTPPPATIPPALGKHASSGTLSQYVSRASSEESSEEEWSQESIDSNESLDAMAPASSTGSGLVSSTKSLAPTALDLSFTFVDIHQASGNDKAETRRIELQKIVQKLLFHSRSDKTDKQRASAATGRASVRSSILSRGSVQLSSGVGNLQRSVPPSPSNRTLKHGFESSVTVFAGDFNARAQYLRAANGSDGASDSQTLAPDELQSRADELPFSEVAPPEFRPTYKLLARTLNTKYHPDRIPSMCDRIFVRDSSSYLTIVKDARKRILEGELSKAASATAVTRTELYDTLPEIDLSDHTPVLAIMTVHNLTNTSSSCT